MKRLSFVTWDIADSISEITFRQFELFWKDCGHRRFEDNEYLNMSKKEQKNWYNSIILQEKIFRYISEIRIYNINLFENVSTEQFNYTRTYFFPADTQINEEKKYNMESEYLDGYFDIKYSFNKEDRLVINKVKPCKKTRIYFYEIEQHLNSTDDKYLKMIIDNRHYMWD